MHLAGAGLAHHPHDLHRGGAALAATHDLESMRAYIGADSLAFLSIEGLYRAMGEAARRPRGRSAPSGSRR
jgi:glutamine phosphoribosylpyrophosphate amidotransferase